MGVGCCSGGHELRWFLESMGDAHVDKSVQRCSW